MHILLADTADVMPNGRPARGVAAHTVVPLQCRSFEVPMPVTHGEHRRTVVLTGLACVSR